MRQLDSAERDGCISIRLEACHPGAASLNRTMILFDDVIEGLTAPHEHVFPFWILASQKPQCLMAGPVAVRRHLPRPPRQVASQCFAEKRLCGCSAAIGAKQKVDGLAVLIHSAIEVVPFASNTDVRLVDSPGGVNASCPTVPSLLELWHIVNYPAQNRRVGHADSALSPNLLRCRARREFPRARHGAWRSLVAHLLWEQRVGGSNPSAPTTSTTRHRACPANTLCIKTMTYQVAQPRLTVTSRPGGDRKPQWQCSEVHIIRAHSRLRFAQTRAPA